LGIRRKASPVVERWAAGLDVRATAEIFTPATFGSTILLPEEYGRWSAQKREAVMAHERSHVLAHDCHWLWLAKFYKCLFWINPLAWWLEHRIAALAEETSDAAALQVVGDAPAYAEILLEFAAAGRTASVTAGMGRPRIASRIERIVAGNAAAAEPQTWRRFAAGAIVMPAMLLCATLQLASSHWAFAHERMAVGGRSNPPGPVTGTPRVLGWPTVHQLIQFYPSEARRAGIDGLVTIAVGLDGTGQVTDTQVLEEEPLNFGFGTAASAVAHVMKYSNPTGRAAQLKVRVQFALHHEHASVRHGHELR
jgi:TonB family protein